MKSFIAIILLMLTTSIYAQSRSEIVKLENNLYEVTRWDGDTKQTGYYIEIEGRLVHHGNWTLRSNNKVLTRGLFNRGVLQEISIYENNQKLTYTKTEIEINRLKSKIYKLENMLLTTNR